VNDAHYPYVLLAADCTCRFSFQPHSALFRRVPCNTLHYLTDTDSFTSKAVEAAQDSHIVFVLVGSKCLFRPDSRVWSHSVFFSIANPTRPDFHDEFKLTGELATNAALRAVELRR
jgi:hypothetical protein